MAWQTPSCLQVWAARAAVLALVAHTEHRVRCSIALVPAELLIARATAGLLLHRDGDVDADDDDDDDDDDDEYGDEVENSWERRVKLQQDVDIMDYALLEVKDTLTSVRAWWTGVPGKLAGPGHFLNAALETHTEVHPRHDLDFPRHLAYILLKLTLLNSVFIDRDYNDKDRQCVVPFAWERWVTRLVAKISPFTHLKELKIYGGMYPSILAAILRVSPNLTSIYISHINITDEILMAISKWCPKLEVFYLLHCFPWQVISMKAFCSSFFQGATKRELMKALRTGKTNETSITFTTLKKVEMAYGEIDVAREFHRLLLSFYPELTSLSCDWKTNLFENGYSRHGQDVLLPVVSKGNHLSVECVYLDGETLYTLDSKRLHQLAWCCPLVKILTLDCVTHGSSRMHATAGQHLAELASEWPELSEIHVNVSSEEMYTHALLMPTLTIYGVNLTSLTVEATNFDQKLYEATLCTFLRLCPNLLKLCLRVWNRSMLVALTDTQEGLKTLTLSKLEELSLHEDGPGDNDEPLAETGHLSQWLTFLQDLVSAAPKLLSLSISVCQGLTQLIEKLTCRVSVLHLHVKDGHEWQPTADQVCQLVRRQPCLQHLYLEEVSGRIFWRVKRRFQYTNLSIHWGNLHGWPRT